MRGTSASAWPIFSWRRTWGCSTRARSSPLLLIVGITRGWLWSREIRFFTVAAALIAFYAFGWYTPVFRAMYELMPGVKLFRRPADATFVFGALIAVMAGYVVHRWLAARSARPLQRLHRETGSPPSSLSSTIWLAETTVGANLAMTPILTGLRFAAAGDRALAVRLARARRSVSRRDAARRVHQPISRSTTRRTNRPACRPRVYDALRPDTRNETVALIRQRLATQAPDHRDRVELIGIGYHWPNICLIHGCEHVFGHNPLRLKWFYDATRVGDTVAAPGQRPFSPLYPSYRSAFADLFGLRLIATGVPVEQIDKSLKPGDLNFVARTADAYVYENPRALPRVMMVGDWKIVDFARLTAEGWPAGVDPRRPCCWKSLRRRTAGFESRRHRTTVRYANTEASIEVDSPSGAMLVLNDVWHPWWRATTTARDRDLSRQCDLPRRAGAAGDVHRAVHLRAAARRVAGIARETERRTVTRSFPSRSAKRGEGKVSVP